MSFSLKNLFFSVPTVNLNSISKLKLSSLLHYLAFLSSFVLNIVMALLSLQKVKKKPGERDGKLVFIKILNDISISQLMSFGTFLIIIHEKKPRHDSFVWTFIYTSIIYI